MNLFREHFFRVQVMLTSTLLMLFFLMPVPVAFGMGNHAVGFIYHRFGEDTYPSTNIRVSQFQDQIDYLADNNFTVLSLPEVIQALQDNAPLPDKVVTITVDDAYRSVYDVAYPLLREKGWPFTVFVATDGVDKGMRAYMTWDQMREMQKHDVTFANHSASHDHLAFTNEGEDVASWRKRVTMDIQTAQQRLRDEFGLAPMLFAYPYGEYNVELMELVAELGYVGLGQQSGAMGILSDTRSLPRFPIAEQYANLEQFGIKASSLPLPVRKQVPLNQVTRDRKPQLTVTLETGTANLDRLACFFEGDSIPVHWVEKKKVFAIQAISDLPAGRSRYNCTAPDTNSNRYFWFSHPWLVPVPGQVDSGERY